MTEFEFLDDGAEASVFGDGDLPETAAFGIFGGGSGCVNEIELHLPRRHRPPPAPEGPRLGIPRGTVYRQVAGGGGGYGDPRERDRETVGGDLRNGVITADAARELYGFEP